MWLRGLDLNQRPLGYERGKATKRQPSDLAGDDAKTVETFASYVMRGGVGWLVSFPRGLGWCGSKLGADDLLGSSRRCSDAALASWTVSRRSVVHGLRDRCRTIDGNAEPREPAVPVWSPHQTPPNASRFAANPPPEAASPRAV